MHRGEIGQVLGISKARRGFRIHDRTVCGIGRRDRALGWKSLPDLPEADTVGGQERGVADEMAPRRLGAAEKKTLSPAGYLRSVSAASRRLWSLATKLMPSSTSRPA